MDNRGVKRGYDDRDFDIAVFLEELADGVDGALGVERVEDGLNEQKIAATIKESLSLELVGLDKLHEVYKYEIRQGKTLTLTGLCTNVAILGRLDLGRDGAP
jgi:hypothetical protein